LEHQVELGESGACTYRRRARVRANARAYGERVCALTIAPGGSPAVSSHLQIGHHPRLPHWSTDSVRSRRRGGLLLPEVDLLTCQVKRLGAPSMEIVDRPFIPRKAPVPIVRGIKGGTIPVRERRPAPTEKWASHSSVRYGGQAGRTKGPGEHATTARHRGADHRQAPIGCGASLRGEMGCLVRQGLGSSDHGHRL
jgi:hypothetical protein